MSTLSSLFHQEIQEHKPPGRTFSCAHTADAGKDLRLSIETMWYHSVLLLFSFHTSTDSGIKNHEAHDSAFVSLLWEYDADLPGAKLFWIALNTSNYSNFSCFRTEWRLNSRSRIAYECKQDKQVFYILPVEYILGKLSIVIQERFHIPCGHIPRGGLCRCSIRYKWALVRELVTDHSRWPVVVCQHVGLELVARKRREMKKPASLTTYLKPIT